MKPCVYVGMTGLPVDHRFENHKNGYKSAWVVKEYGLRLMPELYEYLNPMPFEAAAQMEIELAEDLRAEGYTVLAGTDKRLNNGLKRNASAARTFPGSLQRNRSSEIFYPTAIFALPSH